MAAPPGGPPDSTPPHILMVQPESGKIVSGLKGDAVIRFDEVIDEMGGTGGGGGAAPAGVARQVLLSPVAGDVHVSWHRSTIHIKPAEGWKPGRVYHLELLPGIADLRHNVLKQGTTVIFSTGPAVPSAALSGTVLQWAEQRSLPKALIRAALLPDTLAYVALADSTGKFSLSGIPAGRYRLYAIADQNSNRTLDSREAFDSLTVTVDSSAQAVLWTFVHDTIGPRLRSADPIDSLAFRLVFSQPLDPRHPLDTAAVRLLALPDSTPVPLRGVWTGAAFDSMQTRERALADSLRRASDTTKRAGASLSPPQARAARGAVVSRGAGPIDTTARVDSAQLANLLRQRLVPADRWIARVVKPLTPGSQYLVRVRGATNLTGAVASDQAVLATPAPPTRKDSTRAKPAPTR